MQRSTNQTIKRIGLEHGFTLIELLVVIAIIAIIAGFLFPVFGTIQENARESNTMAHLHDIQLGLGLYKLDNKSYPPVLFAYGCDNLASAGDGAFQKGDGCNVNDTMQTIGGDKNATNELVGLYPEYVKSWQSFMGENDTLDDPNGTQLTSGVKGTTNYGTAGTGPQPNYLCSDGTLNEASVTGQTALLNGAGTCNTPFRAFFKKDAMDVGPEIKASHQLVGGAGNYTYVVRYQTSWTSWNGSVDGSTLTPPDATNPGFDPSRVSPTNSDGSANPNYYGSGSPWLNYTRQLAWANPPADTYVTSITTHVPNANKLIILYEAGNAVKSDMSLGAPPISFQESASGSIAPVAETNAGKCQFTQPSSSTDPVGCSYVPYTFWAINTTNR